MEINKGIQMSGDATLNAGVLAVGDHARAYAREVQIAVAGTGKEEAAERLVDLTNALQGHAKDLDGAEELLESTTTIADELKKEKPNKTTIKGVLSGIAEAATSVTAVTGAVTALRVALGI
jgi:hypothetical protein